MKTLKKVFVRPVFVEYIPSKDLMNEGIIYISREFETSSHLCLCGCKNLIVLPFGENGWSWCLDKGGITITPSVGNYSFPCKSHYIITKGVANFV